MLRSEQKHRFVTFTRSWLSKSLTFALQRGEVFLLRIKKVTIVMGYFSESAMDETPRDVHIYKHKLTKSCSERARERNGRRRLMLKQNHRCPNPLQGYATFREMSGLPNTMLFTLQVSHETEKGRRSAGPGGDIGNRERGKKTKPKIIIIIMMINTSVN